MPMDVTKCIAANVKAIREKKKLTLDSVRLRPQAFPAACWLKLKRGM